MAWVKSVAYFRMLKKINFKAADADGKRVCVCVRVLAAATVCGNSILAHSIIQILCLYVARANLCSCSCSRVLKTLHQLYTRHLAAAPGWVLQWTGNVFIMIAGSPEIRFVDSPCCLAWLVVVAVVVVVVGSAYERGNLLISTVPPHTLRMSDGWIHINWQFIYTKRHHYQRPRRSHTSVSTHTLTVLLSASLSLFFLCVMKNWLWFMQLC